MISAGCPLVCLSIVDIFCFVFSVSIHFCQSLVSAATQCEQLRSQASANRGLAGAYVPQCNADGSFKSEQCWGSTGYCWCVDVHGKEIPGTKISEKPDCSKKGNSFLSFPFFSHLTVLIKRFRRSLAFF